MVGQGRGRPVSQTVRGPNQFPNGQQVLPLNMVGKTSGNPPAALPGAPRYRVKDDKRVVTLR